MLSATFFYPIRKMKVYVNSVERSETLQVNEDQGHAEAQTDLGSQVRSFILTQLGEASQKRRGELSHDIRQVLQLIANLWEPPRLNRCASASLVGRHPLQLLRRRQRRNGHQDDLRARCPRKMSTRATGT